MLADCRYLWAIGQIVLSSKHIELPYDITAVQKGVAGGPMCLPLFSQFDSCEIDSAYRWKLAKIK